jgi:hypothetical protein
VSQTSWHNRRYHHDLAHDVTSAPGLCYVQTCDNWWSAYTVSCAQNCNKLRQNHGSNTKANGLCRYKSCLSLTQYALRDKLESSLNLLITAFTHLRALDTLLAEVRLWCFWTPIIWHVPWNHKPLLPLDRMHPRAWKNFLKTPCIRSSALQKHNRLLSLTVLFMSVCHSTACFFCDSPEHSNCHRLPQGMLAFCVICCHAGTSNNRSCIRNTTLHICYKCSRNSSFCSQVQGNMGTMYRTLPETHHQPLLGQERRADTRTDGWCSYSSVAEDSILQGYDGASRGNQGNLASSSSRVEMGNEIPIFQGYIKIQLPSDAASYTRTTESSGLYQSCDSVTRLANPIPPPSRNKFRPLQWK